MSAINVFQIYFDERSREGIESAFFPYENKEFNDFFESEAMKQVYHMPLDADVKYIGVSSWKQHQKTHIRAHEIIDTIEKDMAAGIEKDVYLYSPVQGLEPGYDFSADPKGVLCGVIKWPDIWHQHKSRFEQIDKDNNLLNDSGVLPFDLFDGKWQYSHCNYWIAKKEVFYDYCKNVLLPALDFFSQPTIKDIMPRWYLHTHDGRYCNSCAFTLEGLFGAFLAHSNYTFTHLCKKPFRRDWKWVRIDGYEIKNELIHA